MSSDYLHYSIEGRNAIVQLNRPEKRNALNKEMAEALKDVFIELNETKEVRCIIIKGHQDAFCAGADLAYLKQLRANSRQENEADSRNLQEMFDCIYRSPKVVMAQVEGPALAGGCGLTAVCDYVFATPEAKFGYTESKIGFVPAIVMVYVLRKFGEGPSRHYFLSGKVIDAKEAKQLGWVFEMVPSEEISNHVLSFANKLASRSSADSIAKIKEMISHVQDNPLNLALEYAVQMNALARETEDCKKGINSFLEKKKLSW